MATSINPKMLINPIINYFENWASFFRLCRSYNNRRKPFDNLVQSILTSINESLSTKQKIVNLKNKVNKMRYRINQMEKLIEENNPHSYIGGKSINQLR